MCRPVDGIVQSGDAESVQRGPRLPAVFAERRPGVVGAEWQCDAVLHSRCVRLLRLCGVVQQIVQGRIPEAGTLLVNTAWHSIIVEEFACHCIASVYSY